MKLKNKILIIISMFVFTLLVFSTSSFAITGTNCNGETIEFGDVSDIAPSGYYFVCKTDSGSIRLYKCKNKPVLLESGIKFTATAYMYTYDSEWTLTQTYSGVNTLSVCSISTISKVYYSNFEMTDEDGNVYYPVEPEVPILENPTISNSSTSWDTGIYDYIVVYSNDLIGDNWQDFYLLSYDYSTETEESLAIYPKKVIPIENGTSSQYYTSTSEDYGYVFYIPTTSLGLNFTNGNNYALKLAFKEDDSYSYFYNYSFTVANLTDEEIIQDKQDITNDLLEEQQEILKEQHETSKGIWGTIKEILSYLNPFSENFFAYKLVELILDGLKSLFIPEDGFFETFFTEMKDWFSERLGFLFYPFELIIDILNQMLNINFAEPIFNIPDIKEPFTNTKLISATTYNLNDMLSNSTLENMHNIYLVVVDAIIVFALVNLAKRKFEEVTDK